MVRWEDCSVEFAVDGAVRQIIIKGLAPKSWQILFSYLCSQDECNYKIDNVLHEVPERVSEVFDVRLEHSLCLMFKCEGISMWVPYLDDDFATIIFWPGDIDSQERLDTLIGFCQNIANMLDRPVDIDQEGFDDWRIFTFYPGSPEPTYYAPRCTEIIDNNSPLQKLIVRWLSAILTWEGIFKRRK